MKHTGSRLPFLDFLRALASQAIVWHHLAFYGPLSDSAREVATSLIVGLAEHARLAVQVFFVVSGYLTATGLNDREPRDFAGFRALIVGRYRRIGLPYLGALILAVVANEVARHWMDHPSISARPTLPQLAAHVFLVHDLIGYEPLSAGIWYLAIDLQLVVLVGLLFWLSAAMVRGPRARTVGMASIGLLGVASLFHFNRRSELDHVALYFIGAYALGMVAAWAEAEALPRALFWAYAVLVAGAIALDFRSRLLVALLTALLLVLAGARGWLSRWPDSAAIRWLAGISYSLFLVHFPVSLVVNALWYSHVPTTPWWSLLGMCVAYATSMLVAVLFHYEVERRLLAWRARGSTRARAT